VTFSNFYMCSFVCTYRLLGIITVSGVELRSVGTKIQTLRLVDLREIDSTARRPA